MVIVMNITLWQIKSFTFVFCVKLSKAFPRWNSHLYRLRGQIDLWFHGSDCSLNLQKCVACKKKTACCELRKFGKYKHLKSNRDNSFSILSRPFVFAPPVRTRLFKSKSCWLIWNSYDRGSKFFFRINLHSRIIFKSLIVILLALPKHTTQAHAHTVFFEKWF